MGRRPEDTQATGSLITLKSLIRPPSILSEEDSAGTPHLEWVFNAGFGSPDPIALGFDDDEVIETTAAPEPPKEPEPVNTNPLWGMF